MNRLAARHETRLAVISARNISGGVRALLQWETGPGLSAGDAVGNHNEISDAARRIETTTGATCRRAFGECSCMGYEEASNNDPRSAGRLAKAPLVKARPPS
jgi:hypothetical protein